MSPLDVRPDHQLLVRVLRDPEQLDHLSPTEFSRLIDTAEQARLLGWVVSQVEGRRAPADPPEWLRDRLATARALVTEYDRSVRWEIDRLDRALGGANIPWVLLKGAAYLAAGLPPGRGRRVADIDVLVPEARLGDAERALRVHGWEFGELDAYDERYYRRWMHELPPMIHAERRSVVDLHHAILPRTSRLQPSSSRLLERAVKVGEGVRVLYPSHMVLHAAAHLFHDGEIAGAIRDLVDVDALLRAFGRAGGFWDDLVREAHQLDLTRPAFYGARYARYVLGTPIPDEVAEQVESWAPVAPVRLMMDQLVSRTVSAPATTHLSSTAVLALYMRSHWLRMPPLLLMRHLLRKAFG